MKKPEEIKKGLEFCANSSFCDEECPYFEECNEGLEFHATDALAYIQQLETQVPRWIPVEERPPEVGADVAIIIENGGYQYKRVGWMRKSGEWFQAGLGVVEGKVTYWAYLPEAPQEDAHG